MELAVLRWVLNRRAVAKLRVFCKGPGQVPFWGRGRSNSVVLFSCMGVGDHVLCGIIGVATIH